MAKVNRTCIVCHKKYSYCGTCAADINKPTWMAVFCCENCRTLYNTINDYRRGSLSKEKAADILNKLDHSSAEELPKNFKESFDEIMANKEVTEEPVVEEIVVPVTEESAVTEEATIEFKTEPIKHKKRKKTLIENIEE